ncbi:MAG TPA: type VI secretion system tip protein TssI/VgrG [Acidobacteriaceae bacterium]|nr:type VI secretion system tip protein TssI/VgrG [Acidobacteriaceae bacterium]
MSSFSQENRLLRFISPLKGKVLLPERLSGVEGISQLFRYTVDLLSPAGTTIDPAEIVAKSAAIGIRANSAGTERFINGIIAAFELCGGDEEFDNYKAVIVPSVWALTLNKNTRTFQGVTVVDVVGEVLDPYSISPKIDCATDLPPLDYCTQYRETDFHFISRLMEQHGIFYYFTHTEDSHVLVMQDDSSKLRDCVIQSKFRYAPESGKKEGFYDFVIEAFASRSTMVTGKFTAWDHSFIRNTRLPDPLSSIFSKGPLGENANESYDFADSPAGYFKRRSMDSKIDDEITQILNVRRDASDAGTLVAQGASNAMVLSTGSTFTLEEHPQNSLNAKYLVTHIEHVVQQLPSFRARSAAAPEPYSNTFTAVPFSIPYRAPFVTPKPTVNGMHSGIVVAPKGEDSFADKFGRVCVKFWWDRKRQDHEVDVTLLRVAQSWAGKGWGTYYWPRDGDEVLIDFIEGDPDQPIVVGSVYNGANMPKYDPRGQYTLSGILTRSSKDGGAANANELRFEDLKGKEQIYMNAERDYDLHVESDWHTLVGHAQHTKVGASQIEEIGKNQFVTIHGSEARKIESVSEINIGQSQTRAIGTSLEETIGDRHVESIGGAAEAVIGGNHIVVVGKDSLQQIANNSVTQVGQTQSLDAGMNLYLKGGMNVVIEAGMNICLSGPGGFISIGPAGIAIQGTLVMINSGGAPVPIEPVVPPIMGPGPSSPLDPTKPEFPGDDPPSKRKAD